MWLLGSAARLPTGALFPVQLLPGSLRLLSALIPMTHSLSGMRAALLQGASFAVVGREILILAAFCAALFAISLLIFSGRLRRACLHGTLSFY